VSVEPATRARDERMIIQREAPDVSKAMAELEREITLEPVVYEQAVRYFDSEELAHLIWQIAAINVWNRVAIATRTPVGDFQP
jgi:hypothetical protein